MSSPRRAALFDLDRTLVRTDTATLFTRYEREIGAASWRDTVRVGWWLLQYTAGTLDARRVAERALGKYVGMEEAEMRRRCAEWFPRYVLPQVPSGAREAVARHRARGDVVAIVTGATPYAAEPLAEELGIEHVLCNRLEVSDGRFTGRIEAPFCYGRGKIEHAERLAEAEGFSLETSAFYTDSITDLPLLERVGTAVCINPDARLRRAARSRGWRVERW